jgi:hypothetical protein
MPEDERTVFSTPIPLRDKDSGPRPNPWTRLEAADVPRRRLNALAELIGTRGRSPDPVSLGAVVVVLAKQLEVCLRGDLRDVEDVRDGTAELADWLAEVERLLWVPGPPDDVPRNELAAEAVDEMSRYLDGQRDRGSW